MVTCDAIVLRAALVGPPGVELYPPLHRFNLHSRSTWQPPPMRTCYPVLPCTTILLLLLGTSEQFQYIEVIPSC